uniref:Uncharacterized protein n=1 Tax=Anguilla anguilla TaxID=7936 RepID=A0A0E9VHL9_ANGAN
MNAHVQYNIYNANFGRKLILDSC